MKNKTEKKRELLFSVTIKDCVVETFRSGGKGGQNQNKRSTGVRIKHPPSGAVGECRNHRQQIQNKREAFKRMFESKKFKLWHRLETARAMGKPSIEELVEKAMDPKNIKTEVKDEKGRWIPWKQEKSE